LEGLKLWVAALRGSYYRVLDTYGPLLGERSLTPKSAARFDRVRRDLHPRTVSAGHRPAGSSGTSTAFSCSAAIGTTSRVRSLVAESTTGAATPSR
jgi:hypothetical protein